MGLSKAFGSQAQAAIKLGQLHALPTTEDLLFVLATATQNKKPAELPFKNPYNHINFTIKVTPATTRLAPRWTFERNTEQGTVVLWTRESHEVIMIQGKIKIEANYTGVVYQEECEIEAQTLEETQSTDPGSASAAAAALVAREEDQVAENPELEGDTLKYSAASDQQWAGPGAAAEETTGDSDAAQHQSAQDNATWEYEKQQIAAEQEEAAQEEAEQEAAGQEAKEHLEGQHEETSAGDEESEHPAAGHDEADHDLAHHDETEHDAVDDEEAELVAARHEETEHDAAAQGEAQEDLIALETENRNARQQKAGGKSLPQLKTNQPDSRSAKQDSQSASAMPPPVVLHPSVVSTYLNSLSDPATGLLCHGAFEFFLLRDSEYTQKSNGKMSLLVFDFVDEDSREAAKEPTHVSTDAAASVAGIITAFCTSLELCTQLRTGEFAILLSGYDGKAALQFAERISSKLASSPTGLKTMVDLNALAIGVACIPETCKDPGTLIAAAIKAKTLARESRRSCMLFPSSKRRR